MQYINIKAGETFPLILGEDLFAMNTAKYYFKCDTSGVGGDMNIILPKISPAGSQPIRNWWF